MPTVALPSRGIQINYHAFGNGPEYVVLVNGFMMTYHGWCQQVQFFTDGDNAARYTVLAFDNRGVGRSSSITGPCSISTLALDLLALLTELHWNTFHLIGISMGGMISLEIAARAPSRLKSLILMNTHGGGWNSRPPWIGFSTVIKSAAKPDDMSVTARNTFGNPVFEDPAARKRLFEAHIDAWARLKDVPRNIEVGRALTQIPDSTGPRPSRTSVSTFLFQGLGICLHYLSIARLESIRDAKIPTTIMVGTDDALIRPANSYDLYRALTAPWVRLHTFENGGHAIIMESVEKVNDLILEQLEAVQEHSRAAAGAEKNFQWPECTTQTIVTSSVGLSGARSKL